MTSESVSQPTLSAPPSADFLRRLGYEFDLPAFSSQTPEPGPESPPTWPAEQLYFASVCTVNHVAFARTLLESLTKHHGPITFILTVVDALDRSSVNVDGAIVLTGRDVFGEELNYAALKFSAFELCCAAKPYMLSYLLHHSGAQRFVYVDCDIYAFARFESLINAIEGSHLVVIPHTFAPLPNPDHFWERPSLGDLFFAGVFNAGLFGMRRSEASAELISTWKRLVTAPGAFMEQSGGLAEQQSFNWILCFTESISILRDRAYNVAYWNLHDRSLRYVPTEKGDSWTVDGKPLVSFHYSGFLIDNPLKLSVHANRYDLYNFPAVARLCDFYARRVRSNDRGELGARYRFDFFPSGIEIDRVMREIFREHEVFIRRTLNPWTAQGEVYYARALLSPIPYTGSLAPIMIQRIYDIRPDLQQLGDFSFHTGPLVRWVLEHGADDYGYRDLFDKHRPTIPTAHGAQTLLAICEQWPRVLEGLGRPVRDDFREFIDRLNSTGSTTVNFHDGHAELFITTHIDAIRGFLKGRPDVVAAFPDYLFVDSPGIIRWLRDKRFKEHYLPVESIDAFAARVQGRALARIFSYATRVWPLMEEWPLGLVGVNSEKLARSLIVGLRHTLEYDVDDVEMFLWIMEVKPEAGLALTLELPIHTTRHPSSRSVEGQSEILAPLLASGRRFSMALADYRQHYPPVEDPSTPSRRTAADVSVLSYVGPSARRVKRVAALSIGPGANVFGYHKSDIGLGEMSRGVVSALEEIGCRTSSVVLGNIRMDDDLAPGDFIQRYDSTKGTNIFVSYPHMSDYSLLRAIPDEVIERHRNISYLAWEQRDGSPYWREIYDEYDQVWALSDFTAESLTGILQRRVHSVPCVVDTTRFPAPSKKELHGIDPSAFAFLFIFDANSSTERKYPEAVVEAFRIAFRSDDNVRLLIKASSADRISNRARLQRLMGLIGTQRNIEVRHADLDRTNLYGLISVCDCYVSLHRSEGFGYTCAEAMVYAKPVIATGYSGNMQFMTQENSYPVRYDEIESAIQEGPFHRGSLWAEPDVKHAAELMRRVFESRDEAAEKGALGRRTIEEGFSPAAIGNRVRQLLG